MILEITFVVIVGCAIVLFLALVFYTWRSNRMMTTREPDPHRKNSAIEAWDRHMKERFRIENHQKILFYHARPDLYTPVYEKTDRPSEALIPMGNGKVTHTPMSDLIPRVKSNSTGFSYSDLTVAQRKAHRKKMGEKFREQMEEDNEMSRE